MVRPATTAGVINPTAVPTVDLSGLADLATASTANVAVEQLIPTHEHDSEAETGLVVVCVLIWIAVMILIIVFFYQYCKEKKGNGAVAYEV